MPETSEIPVIKAEGLSKKFSRSLRTSLWYGLKDMARQFRGAPNGSVGLREQEFWALQDISFELKRGESLGIIGNNGAGKSTLLKLLMGRLLPTSGKAVCYGKIVAITHLGLGFNPILSGRENVFINAAILGMPRKKTMEVFDAIVEFAGIGDFIDSPVQTYSAGMKARLGYAVAAHLNPDILLIDEVLAVGDLAFKRKCRRHIRNYIDGGGTLILISHDMQAVQTICNRCILLEHGRILFDGGSTEGVHYYYETQRQSSEEAAREELPKALHRNGSIDASSPLSAIPPSEVVADSEMETEAAEVPAAISPETSGNSSSAEFENIQEKAKVSDSPVVRTPQEVAAAEDALREAVTPPQDRETPESSSNLESMPPEPEETSHDAANGVEHSREAGGVKAVQRPRSHHRRETHSASTKRPVPTLSEESPAIIEGVRFEPLEGDRIRTGGDVRVIIEYRSLTEIDDVVCGFTICSADLHTHIGSGLFGFEQKTRSIHQGRGEISCIVRQLPLLAGRYAVKAGIGDASTGGAIANLGWDGTLPDYFVVESEAKVVNNMHSVIGDLIKLNVEWQ